MKKGDKALVTTSRVSNVDKADDVHIQIVGTDGSLIRVSLTMEGYAEMMTGTKHVEAEVVRSALIGDGS